LTQSKKLFIYRSLHSLVHSPFYVHPPHINVLQRAVVEADPLSPAVQAAGPSAMLCVSASEYPAMLGGLLLVDEPFHLPAYGGRYLPCQQLPKNYPANHEAESEEIVTSSQPVDQAEGSRGVSRMYSVGIESIRGLRVQHGVGAKGTSQETQRSTIDGSIADALVVVSQGGRW
jgi:hypothetical protein